MDAVAAERRQQHRRQAGGAQQWAGRHVITIGAQHGHARQVLRGHGDDKQWNADADDRGQGEARRGPFRHRQLQLEVLEIEQAEKCGQHAADNQRRQHGVPR